MIRLQNLIPVEWHMYRKQYHIYRDKPQLFGYKKKNGLGEQNC